MAIFIYFLKAFDKVLHSKLLLKLKVILKNPVSLDQTTNHKKTGHSLFCSVMQFMQKLRSVQVYHKDRGQDLFCFFCILMILKKTYQLKFVFMPKAASFIMIIIRLMINYQLMNPSRSSLIETNNGKWKSILKRLCS